MSKQKILSSAFRTDREGICFENKTIKKHFTTQKKELDQISVFQKISKGKINI